MIDLLRGGSMNVCGEIQVAGHTARAHASAMFVVSEAEAAAIRAVYEQRGEFAAAVELRRLFPGVTDNAHATGVRPARLPFREHRPGAREDGPAR